MTRRILSTLSLVSIVSTALAQSGTPELIRDESSVTYRISHPLHIVEATSKDVTYQVVLDPSTKQIRSVTAQVDVTTFDSGNSNRDSHAMEVLDAITYPDVNFASTSVTPAGDSIRVAGKLTFHGVTRDIVAMLAQVWTSDQVTVKGTFDVSLTDFKVDRPSLLMIPVDDTLRFIVNAAFRLK